MRIHLLHPLRPIHVTLLSNHPLSVFPSLGVYWPHERVGLCWDQTLPPPCSCFLSTKLPSASTSITGNNSYNCQNPSTPIHDSIRVILCLPSLIKAQQVFLSLYKIQQVLTDICYVQAARIMAIVTLQDKPGFSVLVPFFSIPILIDNRNRMVNLLENRKQPMNSAN